MNYIYEEMEKQNKRFCPFCNQWVNKENYDGNYEGCCDCAKSDDFYQKHIAKEDKANDDYDKLKEA